MNTDYIRALRHLVPAAKLVCNGDKDNYDNIEWHDDRPMPTKEQCDSAMADAINALENERLKSIRAAAYHAESDPLFFGWQRGENTEQEWLDKVAEIRDRYPYIP